MNQINISQVQRDIFNAEVIWGAENIFWNNNFKWIMIRGFALPKIYNKVYTNCLIPLPSGYGYGTKLEEFYLDKGLKVKRNGRYQDLPHYYKNNVSTGHNYYDKNWQWLCIHPKWSDGDNLLTFMKQVELFLKFPFEENLI